MTASTVRNRTLKVGKRLQKSAEVLAPLPQREFCPEAVVGKVLDDTGHRTRFTSVRNGGSETVEATRWALRQHGVEENTIVTVLTDGDAGLRAIPRAIAPQAEHVLDWFHISMKFENLKQLAKGINGLTEGAIRHHALTQLERVKWRFWHGRTQRGLIGLVHLRQWAHAQGFKHLPVMTKLGKALFALIRYLESNADSLPNYGQRYREGRRISTGFAESAVNEIIAKRMTKKQQMRWNRYTVQPFLDVRVYVLNGTLEQAFRRWHKGFRPLPAQFNSAAAA